MKLWCVKPIFLLILERLVPYILFWIPFSASPFVIVSFFSFTTVLLIRYKVISQAFSKCTSFLITGSRVVDILSCKMLTTILLTILSRMIPFQLEHWLKSHFFEILMMSPSFQLALTYFLNYIIHSTVVAKFLEWNLH